ncbi:PAS domain-containing protein [Paremcibacter congregatus]|uniref:PAS domain-containing protein n=1 Tax=Paremcibacter congregatus TaxID=2043170 RepID=UPI0030EDC708|tara:strand:- start:671 stop:1276 length:606 start_codon:yes stop_codon:yes gene_type:complete
MLNEIAAGEDIFLEEHDVIVSKTDLKGRILYVNETFRRISQFSEQELVGEPHSIIRHADMPRCIFKLLWQKLEADEEVFAYVKNRCKNGDYYWVFAHVTPSYDSTGKKVGYHSNRRVPPQDERGVIESLYRFLKDIEESYANKKEGMQAAYDILRGMLKEQGTSYDQFIFEFASFLSRETIDGFLNDYRPATHTISQTQNG